MCSENAAVSSCQVCTPNHVTHNNTKVLWTGGGHTDDRMVIRQENGKQSFQYVFGEDHVKQGINMDNELSQVTTSDDDTISLSTDRNMLEINRNIYWHNTTANDADFNLGEMYTSSTMKNGNTENVYLSSQTRQKESATRLVNIKTFPENVWHDQRHFHWKPGNACTAFRDIHSTHTMDSLGWSVHSICQSVQATRQKYTKKEQKPAISAKHRKNNAKNILTCDSYHSTDNITHQKNAQSSLRKCYRRKQNVVKHNIISQNNRNQKSEQIRNLYLGVGSGVHRSSTVGDVCLYYVLLCMLLGKCLVMSQTCTDQAVCHPESGNLIGSTELTSTYRSLDSSTICTDVPLKAFRKIGETNTNVNYYCNATDVPKIEYMLDTTSFELKNIFFENPIYETYWQSKNAITVFGGSVTEEWLLVNVSESFLIRSIKASFIAPLLTDAEKQARPYDMRPMSTAIEYQTVPGGPWLAWRYYAEDCATAFPEVIIQPSVGPNYEATEVVCKQTYFAGDSTTYTGSTAGVQEVCFFPF